MNFRSSRISIILLLLNVDELIGVLRFFDNVGTRDYEYYFISMIFTFCFSVKLESYYRIVGKINADYSDERRNRSIRVRVIETGGESNKGKRKCRRT